MNAVILVVIAVLAIWCLALTLAVWAMARNFASLSMAQQVGPVPLATINLDESGPTPGLPVTPQIQALMGSEKDTLLFLSVGCGTCLEVSNTLASERSPANITAVVVGPTTGAAAEELLLALKRTGVDITQGEQARTSMQSLGVSAIPYAVRVHDGVVTHSRYVRKAEDILRLGESTNSQKVGVL